MDMKSFRISSAGLRNIIFSTKNGEIIRKLKKDDKIKESNEENSFRFILGDTVIEMPRILAEFISPRVSHIHQTDPTIEFLDMSPFYNNPKTTQQTNENEINKLFHSLKQICLGYGIDIDEEAFETLKLFSLINWNNDLFESINQLFTNTEAEEQDNNHENEQKNKQTIEKYFRFLFNISQIDNDSLHFNYIASLIEYLASHFYLIDRDHLFQLNFNDLYLLISHPKLKINDEDTLFDTINQYLINESQNQEDETIEQQRNRLYEHINISQLSEDKKKEFLNSIKSTEFTSQLWSNIRDHFMSNISSQETKHNKCSTNKIQEINYNNNGSERFKGIFYKLGEGNAMNALNKGIINITASSVYSGVDSNQPKNVLNFENDKYCFYSGNQQNSWLCFDFKDNKVSPSNYSMKSNGWGGPTNHHP